MQIHHGDCLEVLKTLPENSVDSLVTDPPAGIGFMGKEWDSDKGGRQGWTAWLESVMRECHRVMKPGAHGLVWAIPRTSHWTGAALEDAGFEVRDVVTHLFGSGFPKSMDISKAIDKAAGAERPVIGSVRTNVGMKGGNYDSQSLQGQVPITAPSTDAAKQWEGWGTALKPAAEFWFLVRKPISEKTVAANVLKWGVGGLNIDGCRIEGDMSEHLRERALEKSDSVGYGADSWQKKGTVHQQGRFPANLVLSGDAPEMLDAQSGTSKSNVRPPTGKDERGVPGFTVRRHDTTERGHADTGGASRFFFRASDDTLAQECQHQNHATESANDAVNSSLWRLSRARDIALGAAATQLTASRKEELLACLASITSCRNFTQIQNLASHVASQESTDTTETIQSLWKLCGYVHLAIEESIKQENLESAKGQVQATRFLYSAKTSTSERNAGLEGMPDVVAGVGDERPSGQSMQRLDGREARAVKNHHPTVKPQKLMRYLCRLITPPNGVVLDPFMGSGSTGVAAKAEGFSFIGIEREAEYVEISKKRIQAWI